MEALLAQPGAYMTVVTLYGRSMDPSFWRDRNVLVTGASGLLGTWLCDALLAGGAHVIGFLRDQVPRSRLEVEGIGKRMTLVHGDVTERETIERAVNEYRDPLAVGLNRLTSRAIVTSYRTMRRVRRRADAAPSQWRQAP